MSEHTPTPWKVRLVNVIDIVDVNNQRIAHVSNRCDGIDNTMRKAEEHANAAFIVRAVNSHDELLEALEAYQRMADKVMAGPDSDLKTALEFIAPMSRAAIRNATGEA